MSKLELKKLHNPLTTMIPRIPTQFCKPNWFEWPETPSEHLRTTLSLQQTQIKDDVFLVMTIWNQEPNATPDSMVVSTIQVPVTKDELRRLAQQLLDYSNQ